MAITVASSGGLMHVGHDEALIPIDLLEVFVFVVVHVVV